LTFPTLLQANDSMLPIKLCYITEITPRQDTHVQYRPLERMVSEAGSLHRVEVKRSPTSNIANHCSASITSRYNDMRFYSIKHSGGKIANFSFRSVTLIVSAVSRHLHLAALSSSLSHLSRFIYSRIPLCVQSQLFLNRL
jgi:hypothetical protein